ncbi:hypothetical protein BJAS_P1196 [Bathymodiolus japonicus methanotrophic gill symbiont]|uniref:type II toxin-antitoxin system VapC family toxin n=1 Tax=Bathymodiolus japonicus methanotrophic gill symbiont TaxID=113269 RepID=UPI001B3E3865|nr:type II toxin-antitoxin system VapC family toxin [Bathymodiolus japonicus methanotrophic gill symbiont]GFO71581.1 hypothetical protein BJAS_P1196 [Bathymodiolus japonicus methanotrophic gill symbiont]
MQLLEGKNLIFISSATVWELSIKQSLGRLEIPDNLLEEIDLHRFTQLGINSQHAQLAGKLPNIHKDPFDRMLIAQAKIEKLTLVTRDKLVAQYDVAIIEA